MAPYPVSQVVLFPRPTRNPEGAAADWDWCWHQGLGPSLVELPPKKNKQAERRSGQVPKLPWFPEPPVFKEAHPKTPGLSSALATGSGSLDSPCQRNPPQLWHPFQQPKGQLRPRSPSGHAHSPTLSGPWPGGLHSPLHRTIQKSSSENMARARAAPRPPTARAITAAPHTGGPRGAKNGKSRSEWPPSPQKKSKKPTRGSLPRVPAV